VRKRDAERQRRQVEERRVAAARSLLPPPGFGDVLPVNAPPIPYQDVYADQVRAAAVVGYTQTELCRLLGVGLDTLNLWRMIYADFDAAVRTNDQARHDRVENAFYQRAVGYDQPGEKLFCNADGQVTRAQTMVHVPADPGAAMNWLKVHRPDVYAKAGDQPQSIEVNVSVTQVRATIEGKLARLAARLGEAGVPGQPDPAGDGGAGVELGLLGPA
jgi:hypothetical protein